MSNITASLPSQIDLISAIANTLGDRRVSPGQFSVIVAAADSVLAEFQDETGAGNDPMQRESYARVNAKLLSELKDLEGFVRKFGCSSDRVAFGKAVEGYLHAAREAIASAEQAG